MRKRAHKATRLVPTQRESRLQGLYNPMAKGSRLPGKEGVRVGVMPNAFTILSTGTGEPDAVKVARPVRRGAGRKGGLTDLARGLPYLRCGFQARLRRSVRRA